MARLPLPHTLPVLLSPPGPELGLWLEGHSGLTGGALKTYESRGGDLALCTHHDWAKELSVYKTNAKAYGAERSPKFNRDAKEAEPRGASGVGGAGGCSGTGTVRGHARKPRADVEHVQTWWVRVKVIPHPRHRVCDSFSQLQTRRGYAPSPPICRRHGHLVVN